GEHDGAPVKVGVALIDAITALYAHGAILAALHHRERTGEGQYLELSLMECGIAALINAATGYLVGGDVQGRWGALTRRWCRIRPSGRVTGPSWWAPATSACGRRSARFSARRSGGRILATDRTPAASPAGRNSSRRSKCGSSRGAATSGSAS